MFVEAGRQRVGYIVLGVHVPPQSSCSTYNHNDKPYRSAQYSNHYVSSSSFDFYAYFTAYLIQIRQHIVPLEIAKNLVETYPSLFANYGVSCFTD